MIGILTIVCAAATAVYPYAFGTLSWLGHRTVPYCGGSLPLPFRWTHDPNEHPYGSFSIQKSSWSLVESSVSFSAVSNNNPNSYRARWLDMHQRLDSSRLVPSHIGVDTKEAFHGADGKPLLCAETQMPEWIMLDCVTDNSRWHFNFSGAAADVKEADQSIRYLLSHESEFSQHPSPKP